MFVLLQGHPGGGGYDPPPTSSYDYYSSSCDSKCGDLLLGLLLGVPFVVVAVWAICWCSSNRLGIAATLRDRSELCLSTSNEAVRWVNLRVELSHCGHSAQNSSHCTSEPFVLRLDNLTRRMEAHGSDRWGGFSLYGAFALLSAKRGQFRLRQHQRNSCGCDWATLDGDIAEDQEGRATLRGSWALASHRDYGEFTLEPFELGEGQRVTIVARPPHASPQVQVALPVRAPAEMAQMAEVQPVQPPASAAQLVEAEAPPLSVVSDAGEVDMREEPH